MRQGRSRSVVLFPADPVAGQGDGQLPRISVTHITIIPTIRLASAGHRATSRSWIWSYTAQRWAADRPPVQHCSSSACACRNASFCPSIAIPDTVRTGQACLPG